MRAASFPKHEHMTRWLGMVTYEKEPDAALACLLLFRARSLSPCVRPLRSSSSLYCKSVLSI